MKTKAVSLIILFVFLGSVVRSDAQVKQVQMHIAGYLCGN